MRPLLIFGLRGTLVERVHVRSVLAGMRAADLTVGVHKVWLRPHMLRTLLALQQHCDLAVWSSTTTRNTVPLIEAVFNNRALLREHLGSDGDAAGSAAAATAADAAAAAAATMASSEAAATATSDKADADAAAKQSTARKSTSRFSKVKSNDATATAAATAAKTTDGSATDARAAPSSSTAAAAATTSDAAVWKSPYKFAFVWTREHTVPDELRRMHVLVREDEHATVKDVRRVFDDYAALAQPRNTILIDDTPSKAKTCADNFLWLDSCEGLDVHDDATMPLLREFVEERVLRCDDVRTLLPHRIRRRVAAASATR